MIHFDGVCVMKIVLLRPKALQYTVVYLIWYSTSSMQSIRYHKQAFGMSVPFYHFLLQRYCAQGNGYLFHGLGGCSKR